MLAVVHHGVVGCETNRANTTHSDSIDFDTKEHKEKPWNRYLFFNTILQLYYTADIDTRRSCTIHRIIVFFRINSDDIALTHILVLYIMRIVPGES